MSGHKNNYTRYSKSDALFDIDSGILLLELAIIKKCMFIMSIFYRLINNLAASEVHYYNFICLCSLKQSAGTFLPDLCVVSIHPECLPNISGIDWIQSQLMVLLAIVYCVGMMKTNYCGFLEHLRLQA